MLLYIFQRIFGIPLIPKSSAIISTILGGADCFVPPQEETQRQVIAKLRNASNIVYLPLAFAFSSVAEYDLCPYESCPSISYHSHFMVCQERLWQRRRWSNSWPLSLSQLGNEVVAAVQIIWNIWHGLCRCHNLEQFESAGRSACATKGFILLAGSFSLGLWFCDLTNTFLCFA